MCYEFTHGYCPITGSGFPHSEISGSLLTYSSPEHIGVSAVLLRLLVPRHPPCALSNLTNSASNPRRDPSSAARTPSSRTQKYAPVFACLLPRLACVLKPSVFRKLAEKIQPCHFMNRLFRFCFNVVLSSFQRTSLKVSLSSSKRQLTHLLQSFLRNASISSQAFQQPVELSGVFRFSREPSKLNAKR